MTASRARDEPEQTPSAARVWTLRAVLGAVFGISLFFTVPMSVNAYRVPQYTTTPGTIVTLDRDAGVAYEYTVDGSAYTGTRAQLFISNGAGGYRGGGVKTWESNAEAFEWAEQRTSLGETVTVFYLPSDPTNAMLTIDVHPTGRWVMLLVTPVLAVVFIVLMFAVKKSANVQIGFGRGI